MTVAIQNIVTPADILPELYPDVYWFIQEQYVNLVPLMSRVQREECHAPQFKVLHNKFRPRKFTVSGNLNSTDTYSVLTIADLSGPSTKPGYGDTTCIQAGDVLDLGAYVNGGPEFTGERVEVISVAHSDPAAQPGATQTLPNGVTLAAPGTIVVRRGVESTTVAAQTGPFDIALVGNARNGGEVFQNGIRHRPYTFLQNIQNFQFPVQIGGATETASDSYGLQPGSQFTNAKVLARENMLLDMERTSWYGVGEAAGVYTDGTKIRPKQTGIRNQCMTNRITAPTNSSAYTPYNFIVDVLEPLWDIGSQPDIIMANSRFLGGLTAWSKNMVRIDVGQTTLGVEIEVFESNLAPGIMIMPCRSLAYGDFFVGMSSLIKWRYKLGEQFWPRGIRGYAYEGDWLSEGAIELRDEEKHAFVTGVTGYAPE